MWRPRRAAALRPASAVRAAACSAALCAALLSGAAPAEAQQYTGVLSLDHVPPAARAGSAVHFAGQLSTTSGHVVPGATIHVKDDVRFGFDRLVAKAVTGDDGRFSASWTARPRSSGLWDFYAVFEGSSQVSKARSQTHSVAVTGGHQGGPPSGGGRYHASIVLDPVPRSAYAGDAVEFTGRLHSGGAPLAGRLVKVLEDDPLSPDQRLGHARTAADGTFRVPWRVGAGLLEVDFDVYAVFDGDGGHARARSANQEMAVLKRGGSISLDPLPASARVGERVEFSGTLRLDGHTTRGAVVYVKDEDTLSGDDLLATAYVGGDGRFRAEWIASHADPDGVVDVYAVFEGTGTLYRLTTCDGGPTPWYGGSCGNTVKMAILDRAPPAAPLPPPGGGEYMEMYYSLDLGRAPRVTIVPSPDSYDEVRGHIAPAMEGVRMWERHLAGAYGGSWGAEFEVVSPGSAWFGSEPDIIMNIVTHDGDSGCLNDYHGIAYGVRTSNPQKPVSTSVCSTYGGQRLADAEVASTAGHEFIHAMGLGHAFNKAGDLMCSVEEEGPTCPGHSSWATTPSALNLAAVARMYGTDGFQSPNNHVAYKSRFSEGGSGGGGPWAPPPQASGKCPEVYSGFERDLDGYSLEPLHYVYYTVCMDGALAYSFSTDSEYDGFEIYLLPPETDVEAFMGSGDGLYYTCEEYGQSWHRKSGSCNIEAGSALVLHNHEDDGRIRIDGRIRGRPGAGRGLWRRRRSACSMHARRAPARTDISVGSRGGGAASGARRRTGYRAD